MEEVFVGAAKDLMDKVQAEMPDLFPLALLARFVRLMANREPLLLLSSALAASQATSFLGFKVVAIPGDVSYVGISDPKGAM